MSVQNQMSITWRLPYWDSNLKIAVRGKETVWSSSDRFRTGDWVSLPDDLPCGKGHYKVSGIAIEILYTGAEPISNPLLLQAEFTGTLQVEEDSEYRSGSCYRCSLLLCCIPLCPIVYPVMIYDERARKMRLKAASDTIQAQTNAFLDKSVKKANIIATERIAKLAERFSPSSPSVQSANPQGPMFSLEQVQALLQQQQAQRVVNVMPSEQKMQ